MEKFRNTYMIETARLKNFDYAASGYHFITICTKDRQCYFGNIFLSLLPLPQTHHDASPGNNDTAPGKNHDSSLRTYPHAHAHVHIHLTEIGKIAHQFWAEIPIHFPFVKLYEFVIMPNHTHGLLYFDRPDYCDFKPNTFGPQSQNLAAVIRAFKGAVKRYANKNNIEFSWQSLYHCYSVKSPRRIKAIRGYIRNNPLRWAQQQDRNAVTQPGNSSVHIE